MTARSLGLGILLTVGAPGGVAWAEDPRPDFQDPATRAEAQLDVLAGLVGSGLTDQALDVARDLRASGMKDDRLDVLQATAMHQKGMSGEALTMLQKVVARHPRDAAAWGALGLLHADLKRVDLAVDALQRAARLDKNNAIYLNNLGFVLYAHGDYKGAVEAYQAAVVLDPAAVRTRNNLGFAFARLNKDPEALEAFRAAGDESSARYNLGVACELRNDTACALTNYQAALSARPDSVRVQNALNSLLSAESP